MSFRASKRRRAKGKMKVIEGQQLIPNAGLRDWYEQSIKSLLSKFVIDVRRSVSSAGGSQPVAVFFAADASAARSFIGSFAKARKALEAKFNKEAERLASLFITKTDKTSQAAIQRTVEAMGIGRVPEAFIPDFLGAQIAENARLITNLSGDVLDKVESAINLSLQSPKAGEQGMAGIFATLSEVEGMTKKRAALIARDQTHKAYTSLNTERMKSAGIQKFKWVHSSAGKTPRPCHVARDGQIYLLDGGPDELFHEDGSDANSDPGCRESDKGKPGYAINCRCRQVAVLDLGD